MVKSPEEIKKIREAGKILAKVLQELAITAEEGVALKDLDDLAYGLITKAGASPAFLGYQPTGAAGPYPASICASLNEVVVHGVPTDRRLASGDLLKIDLGVNYNGYIADAAVTLAIGEVSKKAEKLIEVTKSALNAAIKSAKTGKTLGDIGYAVQKTAESAGFKVIKGLTGHGVGRKLHEEPTVFNQGRPGKGLSLKRGMVLAIEPMLSAGSPEIVKLEDDSYRTADSSLSAHFEHTIVISDKSAEILTML